MASSYSTDLKLELQVTGENAGTWGDITNTNFNLLQQAIAGFQSISIAGGAQTTALTMDNGALSNARNAVIKLTGAITGNQIVTIPTGIEKTYIVSNGTTGAFTVEFKQAGGTGITFGTTDKSTKILFADGTNIVDTGTVSESGVQTLTNKTLTSPVIGQINDANGNEEIIFTATASAVNELTIANAATGNAPSISTTGSDTNISLTIAPKGTGDVNIDADTVRIGDSNADAVLTTNGTGDLTISTNAGSNSGTIKIFDAANGNIEITPNGTGVVKLDGLSYPVADGSANEALVTNGSGVLSFAAVGASAGQVIQVLSATDSTKRSTTSSSYTLGSSTLTQAITPSASANKILVHVCSLGSNNGDGTASSYTIFRGNTNLGNANSGFQDPSFSASAGGIFPVSFHVLDSPSTTSSTTYELRFKTANPANSAFLNETAVKGCITLLEIKG